MKKLKTHRIKEVAHSLPPISEASTEDVLRARIETLEELLISVLVRTPEECQDDIKKELALLHSFTDNYALATYINNAYDPKFWLNEADINYKVELAQRIFSYVNARFKGNYKNELIKGIANQSLEFQYLLNSKIFA